MPDNQLSALFHALLIQETFARIHMYFAFHAPAGIAPTLSINFHQNSQHRSCTRSWLQPLSESGPAAAAVKRASKLLKANS